MLLETHRRRFLCRFVQGPGCWIWVGRPATNGYGQMNLGNHKIVSAHRLSWMVHFGPIPDGMCVCHRCDVRLCVRPDHLFLGTRAENNQDMCRKGRDYRGVPRRGQEHPMAKLSDEATKEILGMRLLGIPVSAVAAKFGINRMTVARACTRALGIRRGELRTTLKTLRGAA